MAAKGDGGAGRTVRYSREVPVEDGWDLAVLGGGPGGVAAAIGAARLGAKVLLAEATGCLGGMGTSGLVTAFDPMANGEEMLVGGLMREIVFELYDRGELGPGEHPDKFAKAYMTWTKFRVEGYKRLLDELVVAAGVEVRLFTRLVDAEADAAAGRVDGVVLHNIEGLRLVRARAYVDGTGDGVLADLCGTACREAGRDTPNIMPATLTSLFAGVDWGDLTGGKQQEALARALADGHFSQPDRHLPGLSRVGGQVGYLNGGHLFALNALRCRDLTEGMMLGRRLAKEYLEFYRRYVPGCRDVEHVTTAALLGVRESRRIVGEIELKVDDYLARRQFPDQIGVFNKFIDIHPYDCSEAEWERFCREKGDPKWRLQPGECFGIPYGVTVPRGWRNLWVAGRSASADVQVHGVIRVQPTAAMMGQAAGAAAVQAIRTGRDAAEIDTAELVRSLREQGAHLPQRELTPAMTRG